MELENTAKKDVNKKKMKNSVMEMRVHIGVSRVIGYMQLL